MEAAVIYAREHGNLRVPFTYRVPAGQDAMAQGWPASLANFPLGQWTADARRFYAIVVGDRDSGDQEEREFRLGAWVGNQRSRAATLSPERVEQLSAIGMRWA
ncbi:helicase associated domain-containing protein [Streptomyces sp. NPDC055105]|uniref:helicase associated domain-containing protein n=1 Tax=Streptomyces sp. NPDC055105 TaxID=3365719 RepID=UPI0037D92D20